MSKDQLFNRLFGLLNQLRPGDVMKPSPTTNGAVWSHSDKKHVFLTPELSADVGEKLRLPFPKKQGILMITIDGPLGGWNLTGYQHPFGQYGYGFDIVDISAERTFPSRVAQDFLDDWDGVCVVADNAADMRFHLVRTGLFDLIRHKSGVGFFYLGVNGGAILAADDLSKVLPAGGKTRGLGLIPKTVLPFAEIPQVKYAVDVLNQHFGLDDPQYIGIEKGQVAHFTDGMLEIR
jgi:hypothetical protein